MASFFIELLERVAVEIVPYMILTVPHVLSYLMPA